VQSRDDTQGRSHPAYLVGQRHPHRDRFFTASTLHGSHPAETLDNRVERRGISARPPGAETMNRTINNFRIHLADIGVTHAQPISHARAIVFDHRVAFRRQHPHEISRVVLLQIDNDAALVAIEGEETCRDAVFARDADPPRRVALRWLDLDNIGAQIAEGLGAERAGDHLRKIQDTEASQRSFGHDHPRAFERCCLLNAQAWPPSS
jgi:hypothetical protein